MTTTRCIACNTSPCYISFFGKVECSNEKCEHYSISLYPPAEPVVVASNEEDDADRPGVPVYGWSNYHSDCGDI